MNNILSKFYFFGPLLYHVKLKDDDIQKFKTLCVKDENKFYRNNLAGHIKHEYKIDHTNLQILLQDVIEDFRKSFEAFYNILAPEVYITNAWVNFMRPGDFNPPHTHAGSFSSVLFINMPQELLEENEEHKSHDINSAGPGSISFFAGVNGGMSNWRQDFTPKTGELFMFPADLMHMVYPYKSNVERITISFNMAIVNEKEYQNKIAKSKKLK
ncbi:putative 2OG-Fe(II) oxygenase [Hyphomonas sp.]|uniref:putative 2OG-Fe(II) oxygenase n=1 Tax=Hyphomonas sp. TaxID=87 RepID=UPI000C9308B0|nr:putative 2OG-Fe(II) oxygenase [Hyphomonas sp.]MAL46883.1 hypothetical protein [Hyphomonas sp.]